MILGRRWAAPAFWAASVVLAVLAAIGGAHWGLSQAPTFEGEDNNGAPATSASHLIYSVFGAVICGLAVLAVASGIFFLLWARIVDAPTVLISLTMDAPMTWISTRFGGWFTSDDEPFDAQAPPTGRPQ